jgi:hypothetical protein
VVVAPVLGLSLAPLAREVLDGGLLGEMKTWIQRLLHDWSFFRGDSARLPVPGGHLEAPGTREVETKSPPTEMIGLAGARQRRAAIYQLPWILPGDGISSRPADKAKIDGTEAQQGQGQCSDCGTVAYCVAWCRDTMVSAE